MQTLHDIILLCGFTCRLQRKEATVTPMKRCYCCFCCWLPLKTTAFVLYFKYIFSNTTMCLCTCCIFAVLTALKIGKLGSANTEQIWINHLSSSVHTLVASTVAFCRCKIKLYSYEQRTLHNSVFGRVLKL